MVNQKTTWAGTRDKEAGEPAWADGPRGAGRASTLPGGQLATTVTTVGLWAVAAMGVGPWLTSVAEAKRGAPKEVTPVVDGGTRYAVDHFGGADRKRRGGYVLVENERGERFQMDLASGAVALLKKPGRTELPDEPRTRR
jgi:hypothetical protein